MVSIEFTVTKREVLGKGASKRFRKTGLVPAVVYGKNKENLNIAVDFLKFKKALKTEAGENTIIEMHVQDSDIKKKVLLKEAHLDTLTSNPLHFDFYEISEGEQVAISCPLKFNGRPEGVKSGGVIQTLATEVKVECLPENIPNEIEIEISHMEIGDTLKVEDLPVLNGINIISNPNNTVISILTPRLIMETEEVAASEESESEEEAASKSEEETTESGTEEGN